MKKENCSSNWYQSFICILLKEQFYKNKSLDFNQKIKKKLITKPDLLCDRT